ncbi:MAG: heavy-metal-associated domain-containing protein [Methylophilaceae bacterium]
MTIKQYSVSGMTCGGCVNRVKSTLIAFAEEVEVTLDPPLAALTGVSVNLNVLNAALSEAGKYHLSEINLTQETSINEAYRPVDSEKTWRITYQPLLLVFAYILLVTFAVEIIHGEFAIHRWMPNFMAGFFLVFSFFKMLDLPGFASSYTMYDLLAKKIPRYGFVYPFIELGLGIAYLLDWQPTLINAITLAVMTFSSIGVILAVANKQKIRCACLGAVFNLPMSTVTIIEDLLMAGMALWMLL